MARMIRLTAALTALAVLLLTGCGPDRSPTTYEIPKEALETAPAVASDGRGSATMAQQNLPDNLAGGGATPHWRQPVTWTESEGSSMRRGSFTVPETDLDIAVTTFPGDVGGMLANVNRWRDQIALPPITEAGLAEVNENITTQAGPAVLTRLRGEAASTLSVTLMHHGNSWFFKMTGSPDAVDAEEAAFLQFVRSVHFH